MDLETNIGLLQQGLLATMTLWLAWGGGGRLLRDIRHKAVPRILVHGGQRLGGGATKHQEAMGAKAAFQNKSHACGCG